MTRATFPGATYSVALPDGSRVVEYGDRIEIDGRAIPLPPTGLLAMVATKFNHQVYISGQGHADGVAYLWREGRWDNCGLTHGVSPCAFGSDSLYIALGGTAYRRIRLLTGIVTMHSLQLGSQGIRYVNGEIPVAGDATLFDGVVHEFTDRGEVRGGQGHEDGYLLNGRLLEPGNVQFCRLERDGDRLAVAMVKFLEGQSVMHWLNVSEIGLLPSASVPVEPPPDPEPDPVPDPINLNDYKHIPDEVNRDYPGLIRADEGGYVDQVAHRCNRKDRELGRPLNRWGRKYNSGRRTYNTDALTYLLDPNNRDKKKLIDVIKGDAREPWWDVRPAKEEPGNGKWAPPQSRDRDGEIKPPPNSGGNLADVLAELNAVKARLSALEARMMSRRVALKADNGRYVCADFGQYGEEPILIVNRDAAGAWETFIEEEQG